MTFGIAVSPVTADDIVWRGDPGGRWDVRENWVGNEEPTANDHAIINNGNWCKIKQDYAAAAQRITIATDNMLRMKSNSELTLGDGDEQISIVNGVFEIGQPTCYNAVVKISGDHTIQGSGGVIKLLGKASKIEDNGEAGDELTVESTVECNEGSPPDDVDSLVVTGRGEIHVELFNNAYVVAGESASSGDPLKLKDDDKDSGCCGFWIVEDAGVLLVQATVTGKGTWKAVDVTGDDVGGKFQIGENVNHTGCVAAEGDVFLKSGRGDEGSGAALQVIGYSYFCTTGSLEFKSIDIGESVTQPEIDVRLNAEAEFGGDCDSCSK